MLFAIFKNKPHKLNIAKKVNAITSSKCALSRTFSVISLLPFFFPIPIKTIGSIARSTIVLNEIINTATSFNPLTIDTVNFSHKNTSKYGSPSIIAVYTVYLFDFNISLKKYCLLLNSKFIFSTEVSTLLFSYDQLYIFAFISSIYESVETSDTL